MKISIKELRNIIKEELRLSEFLNKRRKYKRQDFGSSERWKPHGMWFGFNHSGGHGSSGGGGGGMGYGGGYGNYWPEWAESWGRDQSVNTDINGSDSGSE